jgi:hypothetical protein
MVAACCLRVAPLRRDCASITPNKCPASVTTQVEGLKVQHFTVHAAGESIVANVNRRWGIVMAAISGSRKPKPPDHQSWSCLD